MKTFTPITQRQYDTLDDAEKAAYHMEARNAASVIAQRNANNSPDYLERMAEELRVAAQVRRDDIARRAGKVASVTTYGQQNTAPDQGRWGGARSLFGDEK
jgi:hypothetical protein